MIWRLHSIVLLSGHVKAGGIHHPGGGANQVVFIFKSSRVQAQYKDS